MRNLRNLSQISRALLAYVLLLVILSLRFILRGELTYVIPPVSLFLLSVFFIKYSRSKAYAGTTLLSIVLLISIFKIFAELFTGFIEGFGLSPYSRNPWAIFVNIYNLVAVAIAVEFIRAYMIVNLKTRFRESLVIVIVASLFLLVDLHPMRLAGLLSTGNIMLVLWQDVIPVLATNIFLTQLVSIGGSWYAILYRVVVTAYKYLIPLAPIIPFYLAVIPGAVVPFIGLAMLFSLTRPGSIKFKSMASALAPPFALLVLLIIMMKSGLYPLVVASDSMEPSLRKGDIAIVKQNSISDVEKGDIIAFATNGVVIIHRVTEVTHREDGIILSTKGDANREADPWVITSSNYIGELETAIPKIGYISLCMKQVIASIIQVLNKSFMKIIVLAGVVALTFIILGYNKRTAKSW